MKITKNVSADINDGYQKEIDDLKKLINELKKKIHRHHPHNTSSSNGRKQHVGESKEMKMIRDVRSQHGKTLNSLQQNVSLILTMNDSGRIGRVIKRLA